MRKLSALSVNGQLVINFRSLFNLLLQWNKLLHVYVPGLEI